jgi:activator of HSP90 ATPase
MNTEMTSIKQRIIFSCPAKELFDSWLSTKAHSKMINASARIIGKKGGAFSVWDGEITGNTIGIDKAHFTIIQSWRAKNWSNDVYSTIQLTMIPKDETTCKLIFIQSGIPSEFLSEIKQGWKDYYWKPMKVFFK